MPKVSEHFEQLHGLINKFYEQLRQLENEHTNQPQHFVALNDIREAMNKVELVLHEGQKEYNW